MGEPASIWLRLILLSEHGHRVLLSFTFFGGRPRLCVCFCAAGIYFDFFLLRTEPAVGFHVISPYCPSSFNGRLLFDPSGG